MHASGLPWECCEKVADVYVRVNRGEKDPKLFLELIESA